MERCAEQGSKVNGQNYGGRMTRRQYAAAFVLLCVASAVLSACGGGVANPVTIELTTPGGILMVDEAPPNPQPPVAPTLNFTAILGNDVANKGVKWTLPTTAGSCAGTGCGTLTNATPLSVTYIPPSNLTVNLSVVLTATSIAQGNITKTATITVVIPPVFTLTGCNPPSPPNGVACVLQNGNNGIPYSQTISFTGGVSPYMVAVTNGALPACLQLVTSTTGLTATINQTPCAKQTTVSMFTVTITDSGGAAPVSQLYQITIAGPPPLSVTTTSLPPGTFGTPYNTSVVTQGGVAPLTFTFAPTAAGSLPPGDIAGLPPGLSANTATGQITGTPTQQAPPYPKTYSFTVQVEDSSLPAPGQIVPTPPLPLTITIQAPANLVITSSSLPVGMTGQGYTGSLGASGGVMPYTWTVTQGQLPPGLTLDSSGGISGNPVLATTANFTVQVSDSETIPMTATRQFSITIAPCTTCLNNNSLVRGQYSFLFQGFDQDGFVAIAGSLTADGNGNITAGSEDDNRASAIVIDAPIISPIATPSKYVIDPNDGRGTMQITATIGAQSVTIDYDLVLDSNGNVKFFEDNSIAGNTDILQTHGEGIMKPIQGSSFTDANLSGHYAFEFRGQDLAATPAPAALAAVITANGTGDAITGTGDFNDGGTFDGGVTNPQAFSLPGIYTVISGTNRGLSQITFAASTTTPQITLNFVFYFVSPSDLFFVECDNTSTTAPCSTGTPAKFRMAGEMILQNPATNFNSTVLQGSSVTSGIGVSSGNSDVFAGLLTSTICDGNTALTLSYDENNAGTLTSPSFPGTCLVDPSGHATFAGLGATAAATRVAAGYLTGPGQGFVLGSDAAVTTGLLEQQVSGPPFSDSDVLGGYTLSAPYIAETLVPNLLGQVVGNGIGNLTGVIDEVDPTGKMPSLDQAFSANFTSLGANGRGTMTTSATVPTGFPTNLIFYIVSPSSFRMISADTSDVHPNLILLDH
jgi:hypothetical protein